MPSSSLSLCDQLLLEFRPFRPNGILPLFLSPRRFFSLHPPKFFCGAGDFLRSRISQSEKRQADRWSSLQPVETALRFFPRVSSRGYPSIQRREEIFDIFIPVITVNLRSILSEDLLKVFTLLRAVLIIFTRPGSVSFFSFFPFGCIYRG